VANQALAARLAKLEHLLSGNSGKFLVSSRPAVGKARIEGKDHVMRGRDVVEFRFSVSSARSAVHGVNPPRWPCGVRTLRVSRALNPGPRCT
jgi:hypothetical protein